MKNVIRFITIFLCCLLVVGCTSNDEKIPEDDNLNDVTININKTIEQGYFNKLTITINEYEDVYSNFGYSITFDNDNIVKYGSYIFAEKVGITKITLYDYNNEKVYSTSINIVENTSNSEIPVLNLSSNYMTMNESIALRFSNYDDLNLFTFKVMSDNVVMVDNQYRINPLGVGKTDLMISLKSNPLYAIRTTIEVVEDEPKVFLTCDKLYVNEKAYLDISNLGITKGDTLSDFEWILSNDNFILNDDYSVTAVNVGETLLTVTSKANPLVNTTYKLEVISKDYEDLKISIKEENLGSFACGDQFHIVLNEGYTIENMTLGTTDQELVRYVYDDLFMAIGEGLATIYAYETDNPKNKSIYRIKIEGVANVDYISRLLNLAIGEKGYVERYDPVSGEYVNDTKYNHWYNMEGAWCAMFVSWCWYHAGLSNDLLLKYCSVYTGSEWCKAQGIFQNKKGYQPKSGDIVFFLSAGSSHTGIVIYSDANYVYTIEGNASNRVDVWRWSINDARITGYGTPKYPSFEGTREDFSWIKEQKEDGTYWWNNVPEKQEML